MASDTGQRFGPFWSSAEGQGYWYNSSTDRLELEDGRSLPRPPQMPRANLMTQQEAHEFEYQSPGQDTSYTAAGPSSSANYGRGNSGAPSRILTYNHEPQAGSGSSPPSGVDGSNNVNSEVLPRFGDLKIHDIQTTPQMGGADPRRQQQPYPQQQQHPSRHPPLEYRPSQTVPAERITGDTRILTNYDENNGISTLYQTHPVQHITDPALYAQGITARRALLSTDTGEEENLFNTFRVRPNPRKFFTVGKVFLVLWVEPAGEPNDTGTMATGLTLQPGTSRGRYGEMVYSKVRRFVVIKEWANGQFCSALPIVTYGKRGVGKRGVVKSDHVIIYTGKRAPSPMSSEAPGRNEAPMRTDAIRVDPDDPEDKLDPRSRLDLARVNTIQHNIKVKSYGQVNPKSMNALSSQFHNVWQASSSSSGAGSSTSQQRGSNSSRLVADRRGSVSSGRGSHTGGSRAVAGPSSYSHQRTGTRASGTTASDRDPVEDRVDSHHTASVRTASQQQALAIRTAVDRPMNQTGMSQEKATTIAEDLLERRRQEAEEDDDDDDDDDGDEDGDDDDGDDEDEDDGADEDTPRAGTAGHVFSHDY